MSEFVKPRDVDLRFGPLHVLQSIVAYYIHLLPNTLVLGS